MRNPGNGSVCPVDKRACSELPWQPPSPLAHGLKGCSLGLLVLILKEKYFKEHLITVQGAVLAKNAHGINVCENKDGRACAGIRLLSRGDTGLGFANLRCGRLFGHGAMAALGLGGCLGSRGVFCCCKSSVCELGLSLTLWKAQS